MKSLYLILLIAVFTACVRSPIQSREQSLRPTAMPPTLADDLDFLEFTIALEANLKALQNRPDGPMQFGPRTLSRTEYGASLNFLVSEAKADPSGDRFRTALKTHFEAFEVFGQENWGDVFITSYFEPVIEGSKKATEKHSQARSGIPKDLVTVDLSTFRTSQPDLKSSHGISSTVLRGKLVPGAKDQTARVVAYADRAQIYTGVLKEQSKVLAWVDPIDAFFLEIQGSGVVKFKDGKDIKVGYATQNGHPYSAIGKYLFDVIPREKMTQHALESHLRSLPLNEARKILEMNPSYVFFRPLEKRGITALGSEVVSGRTIATDTSYFPKGALAYLEFEKPVFNSPSDIEPTAWQPTSRFVLDQDTGGAIRGPHRVDLFWGQGPEAKQAAGVMKNKGRLVYFLPKSAFLSTL